MNYPRPILCVIPARGGSKRVPNKNVKLLNGRPLIAHTLEHALSSRLLDRIVVSTDSEMIARVAGQYGVETIERPPEISGATATSEEALLHTLDVLKRTENFEPLITVFLQCTSPIRDPGDIDKSIAQLVESRADSLLSVVHFHGFIWNGSKEGTHPLNYDYMKRPRSQDFTSHYLENGSIYVMKTDMLLTHRNRLGGKITHYVMSDYCNIDIDTDIDFCICETILKQVTQN